MNAMHLLAQLKFDYTVTLGNVVVVATLLGFIWRVERAYSLYAVEHEMLITDYCNRLGLKIRDLPTRSKARI